MREYLNDWFYFFFKWKYGPFCFISLITFISGLIMLFNSYLILGIVLILLAKIILNITEKRYIKEKEHEN